MWAMSRYSPPARWRLFVASWAVAIGATVLMASGCGPAQQAGAWWQIPRTKITFPVLWAASGEFGKVSAGIEPAVILAETTGEPTFEVNLGDITTKGAGAQWLAATASAATLATLYTGADPATLTLGYDITGPIDGPSGGAALTLGTIAAIRGDTVRPKVVMTGTILPDGTIGRVGLVPAKVAAAAKDGFTLVLIPVGNRMSVDSASGKVVDVIALGRTLGLTVRTVHDINEAYRDFTGETIAPPAARPAGLSPEARAVAVATTRRTLAAAQASFVRNRSLIPQRARAGIAADLGSARSAMAAGRAGEAYGWAVEALYRIGGASGGARVTTLAREEGVAAARTALAGDVASLLARANTQFQQQSNPAGLRVEQWLTLPSAMGWVVYAQAVLQAAGTALKQPVVGVGKAKQIAQLADIARDVEGERLALEHLGPDAIAVVRAASSRTAVPEEQATAFMSGYSTFLARAGGANRVLYEALSKAPGTTGGGTGSYEVLAALRDEVEGAMAEAGSLQEAIQQSAYATTYYVLGTTLASGDAYGFSDSTITDAGFDKDAQSAYERELLRNAVEGGEQTIAEWTAFLQWNGENMSYPVWQREWSTGIYRALRGTPREESGARLALNEIWYAVMNNLMIRSASLNLG